MRGAETGPAAGRSRLTRRLRAAAWRLTKRAYALVPGSQRPALNLYAYLLRHGDLPTVLSEPPPASRVLVLAPHPDDETIGCGGLLRLLASAGAAVTVVFLSDGRRGYDLSAPCGGSREVQAALATTRRREAESATALLGVQERVFFDLPDGDLGADPTATERLRSELQRRRPELVLLPFLTDQHPDHLETNRLFLRAARGPFAGGAPECWAYETRTPLPANRIVDITAVAATKWAALAAYASQRAVVDYLETTRGLNAFRWLATNRGSGFAEAFHVCPLAEYRRLFAILTGEDVN